MPAKPDRTKDGQPSSAARKDFGGGKDLKSGSYPVFDTKSGVDALDLRGRSADPAAVVEKVARFATRTDNTVLEADVKRVRG
jgi:hypothetical protein